MAVFILYCMIETARELRDFRLTKYRICSPKLNGIRETKKIVFLSDLHNRMYGKENERLLESIKNQHPAEHAPLYSGIPQARGHVRAAGRHRHRAVGAAGRLGAAAGHGLERDRRCRGPVRPARHQRHHPVRDGRVRAGPRGQTTQRLAWRAGGGVRGGGRNRRVRPVRGELLRPDSADRRHDGGHADRVGRFRADLRAVPVAGAARARTDGQALASALRRRRDCLILQADTPEPR